MLSEVLENLRPEAGGYFIDCTLGGGGYTRAIAERAGPSGAVLAIDQDPMAIANFQEKQTNSKYQNIKIANDNFRNLSKIIEEAPEFRLRQLDGIVLDLGLSGAQLEDRLRGFSFRYPEAPLDMAFSGRGEKGSKTAAIVNKYKEEELENIIREYGEERFARQIARKIVEARKEKTIERAGDLVAVIASAVPARFRQGRIHFATKTFQALRIATNDELASLEAVLPQAAGLLRQGGRLVVVSFHSLEDRIIKNFFKKESIDCLCPPDFPACQCGHKAVLKIITKRPLAPTAAETDANPKARSAKLRAAEKI